MTKKTHSVIFALLCLATILFIPLLRGVYSPYLDMSDPDGTFLGQALLYNAGMPQSYFDHTAYIYSLTISFWLECAKFLGLIPISNMTELASASNFGAVFAPLVYSGRIFAMVLASAFVFVFYTGVSQVIKNKNIVKISTLGLAVSEGIAVHTFGLRSDIFSAFFVMIAFFSIVIASKNTQPRALFFIWLAGVASYLSLLAKVQSMICLLLIPPLTVFFGSRISTESNQTHDKKGLDFFYWFSGLIFTGVLAVAFLGVSDHIFRFYQLATLGVILVSILSYKIVYKTPIFSSFVTLGALFSGFGTGYLFNFIHYHSFNVWAIFHYLDHLNSFRDSIRRTEPLFSSLSTNFIRTVEAKVTTFDEQVVLFWILAGSVVWLFFHRKTRIGLQVLGLVGAAFFLEVFFRLRYYSSYYFIFVEYLLFFAFALATVELAPSFRKLTKGPCYFLKGALVSFFLFCGWNNLVKTKTNHFYGFNLKQSGLNFCTQNDYNPMLKKITTKKGKCEDFMQRAELFDKH